MTTGTAGRDGPTVSFPFPNDLCLKFTVAQAEGPVIAQYLQQTSKTTVPEHQSAEPKLPLFTYAPHSLTTQPPVGSKSSRDSLYHLMQWQ